MRRAAALVLGLATMALTAPAARAMALPDEASQPLRAGQPWISVTLAPDGQSALIRAAIDIPAAPGPIWRAMTDCEASKKMIRSLTGCRVLRSGAGWDIREHVTRAGPLVPAFRYVVRSDYEPQRRIRFRRVEGDVRVMEGEWALTALDGGRATRVSYENRLAAPVLAPPFLVRAGLRRDTPKVLENLRRLVTGAG